VFGECLRVLREQKALTHCSGRLLRWEVRWAFGELQRCETGGDGTGRHDDDLRFPPPCSNCIDERAESGDIKAAVT